MSKTLRVTAPYVTLKVQDPNRGTFIQGYYEGAIVENVADDSAQHHLDNGLAENAKPGDEPAAHPEIPADPAAAFTEPTPVVEEPAGNASREDWVGYAVSVKGATPEDLVDADGKDLGRDALREKFGTPSES